MTTRTILAVVVCLLAATSVEAQTALAGRVVGVADGDTITLLDAGKQQHRVRLEGIDSPEKGQPFGDRSKQSLSALAFARDVKALCAKVDRYGRWICRVLIDDLDVGLEQVRHGMAWHFKRYEREQSERDRGAYAAAEARARSERRGLWRDPNPVAPWDWRQERRARSSSRQG